MTDLYDDHVSKTTSRDQKYHLTTFGCQMNQHDSERLKGMLEHLGWTEADARDQAGLILFNTCSIRETADQKFASHLSAAAALKRTNPGTIIGVGGCWAQSVKDEVFELFPSVDVAFGPGQVHKLAEFLTADSLKAQGYFEFEGFTGRLPLRRTREFQAWMQISVGCNCNCSYCIVPSTRGREASRPVAELIAEANRLVADGVKEITLLGQNVNSYGRDLMGSGRATFAELLHQLDAIDGLERIRYTSPHPKDIRADVIAAHLELASICAHIHLPLQAGSSRVLKAMRRTYSRDRYLEKVELIRESLPDVGLTTDIIVGFPGETEAEFQETLEVVDLVGFDAAYTFMFSPRRETEAAHLPDQVDHEVKVERIGKLLELVQKRAKEQAQRFVGREVEVLVEGYSRTDAARLRGRSSEGKAVNFDGVAKPGEIVSVTIDSATSLTLDGTMQLVAALS